MEQPEYQAYTRARTFPKVIGSIAGLNLHTTLSYAQIVVGLFSFLFLLWSRNVWSLLVPGGLFRMAVLLGLPVYLSYKVRYSKFEGRAPRHATAGIAKYCTRRYLMTHGVQNGHMWRPKRPQKVRWPAVYFFSLRDEL